MFSWCVYSGLTSSLSLCKCFLSSHVIIRPIWSWTLWSHVRN